MQKVQLISKQTILNKSFKAYGTVEDPIFLAKDVAEWIDYSKTGQGYYDVNGMLRIVDEEEKVKATINNRSNIFVTEEGLYEILFMSRKPIAKAFKKEVKAILKQLRKTGVVITAAATPEAIDFELRFGARRIRNTFTNSTDIVKDYADFKVYSKAESLRKHLDNQDRINRCNIIVDVLEAKLEGNMTTMRGSEMLSIRETVNEIKNDIITLGNKKHGGIKSNQTKVLKALKEELELAKPSDDKYITLNIHGFSHNYMNILVRDYLIGEKVLVKSDKYMEWINAFPVEDLEVFRNLDFTKPIYFYAKYTMKENFDSTNFIKTLLDRVASYFGVDDRLFVVKSQDVEGYCDDYADGKIKLYLRN